MLSPEHKAIITATVPILEEGGEALTRHFYLSLFRDYPQVKPLFNQANQHDGHQQRALANAVLMYAKNIEKLENLGPLVGTIVSAQSVTYDFDTAANFTRFKTYTWVRGTNVNDELNHQRIMRAIDAQLTARGFSQVEAIGNPDVLVASHASFDRDLEINASGLGGYRLAGPRSGTARVEEIVVGTLAIDMMDAHTKNIVWRGIATKELDAKARPEKKEKNINKAAEKIFKNYPPASR